MQAWLPAEMQASLLAGLGRKQFDEKNAACHRQGSHQET